MCDYKLIVFEGPDGSGKTTVAHRVCGVLSSVFGNVRLLAETRGSPFCETVCSSMLSGNVHVDAHPFLFAGVRAHVVRDVLLPLLSTHHVVLDRFFYSGLVYPQLLSPSLDTGFFQRLAKESALGVCPDICFVLDVSDPNVLWERVVKRGTRADVYDGWLLNRLRALRDLYRRVVDEHQECVLVDASGDVDTVVSRVLGVLNHRFGWSV